MAPANALLEFVGADTRKHRVCVRVHKSGHYHAATGIQDQAIAFDQALDLSPAAHGFNLIAAHQHCTVFNDRQLTQITAGTRPSGPGERYQLRTIHYCESFRHWIRALCPREMDSYFGR